MEISEKDLTKSAEDEKFRTLSGPALSLPPTTAMSSLFPALQPYKTHLLRVSPLHRLSVKEYGNPAGKPVVFLHGGPVRVHPPSVLPAYPLVLHREEELAIVTHVASTLPPTGSSCSTRGEAETRRRLRASKTTRRRRSWRTSRRSASSSRSVRRGMYLGEAGVRRSEVLNNGTQLTELAGSTLALAYAQAHPTRVKSLSLRGVFTVRSETARSAWYSW